MHRHLCTLASPEPVQKSKVGRSQGAGGKLPGGGGRGSVCAGGRRRRGPQRHHGAPPAHLHSGHTQRSARASSCSSGLAQHGKQLGWQSKPSEQPSNGEPSGHTAWDLGYRMSAQASQRWVVPQATCSLCRLLKHKASDMINRAAVAHMPECRQPEMRRAAPWPLGWDLGGWLQQRG